MRLDANLWQGSGGDLLLCSFSPLVQFNNGGGVGGRGHFLPALAPSLCLGILELPGWVLSSHSILITGQRFSCLRINLISSSLEEGSVVNTHSNDGNCILKLQDSLIVKLICPNPNLIVGEKCTVAGMVE